jgi:hypothetical protein
VVLIDQQAPGMGASYGNAGHLATEQVFPIADLSILKRLPAMLMDPMGPLRLDWKYLPSALPWFAHCCSTWARRTSGARSRDSRAERSQPGGLATFAAQHRAPRGCCAKKARCWCSSGRIHGRPLRRCSGACSSRMCPWSSGG